MVLFWRKQQTPPTHTVQTHYQNIFDCLVNEKLLSSVLQCLGSSIKDVYALARVNKQLWHALADDHKLWRSLYVDSDPLVSSDIRKRLLKDSYTQRLTTDLLNHTLHRSGLVQSAWLRCCTLLYSKPRLILVFAGRDPIVVRRLGEPEDSAVRSNLGLNYHLDSYLDEDNKRFAEEFPQIFQDLDPGDLVVTQDFKGAGLYTAIADTDCRPFMRLKKNGRDSAGFGILGKDQAPPFYPLLYYCDAGLEQVQQMNKKQLIDKQMYWYSYTMLRDKSMFVWHSLEVLDAL